MLKNLPVSDAKLAHKVDAARRHLEMVSGHGTVPADEALFYNEEQAVRGALLVARPPRDRAEVPPAT